MSFHNIGGECRIGPSTFKYPCPQCAEYASLDRTLVPATAATKPRFDRTLLDKSECAFLYAHPSLDRATPAEFRAAHLAHDARTCAECNADAKPRATPARGNPAKDEFAECPTCMSKPGSPDLCAPCLHNRTLIERLRHVVDASMAWHAMPASEPRGRALDVIHDACDEYARRMGIQMNAPRRALDKVATTSEPDEAYRARLLACGRLTNEEMRAVGESYGAALDSWGMHTGVTRRHTMSGSITCTLVKPDAAPIPMRLTCPECKTLHIDEGEFATKPHHTHQCASCGMIWRPAVGATVGVRFLYPEPVR